MEERDVQIKGYRIHLPLDVVIVASANPEDYTSRGRIITPLKDRFDVQIRTHYPRTLEDEIAIMEQEVAPIDRDGRELRVPQFMKELVAQVTFEARASNEINQSSGVSVRVSINNYETADLQRREARACAPASARSCPRLSDLHAVLASTAGKIELEYVGEDKKEEDLIERLINRAVLAVCDRFLSARGARPRGRRYFEAGWGVEVSDRMPSAEYREGCAEDPGPARGGRSARAVREPGAHGGGDRAGPRGPAPAPEAQQGPRGGRWAYRA